MASTSTPCLRWSRRVGGSEAGAGSGSGSRSLQAMDARRLSTDYRFAIPTFLRIASTPVRAAARASSTSIRHGVSRLCDGALFVIEKVRRTAPFELEMVDISAPGQEKWFEAYKNDIPVVHLDGKEVFRHRVDERALRLLLEGL